MKHVFVMSSKNLAASLPRTIYQSSRLASPPFHSTLHVPMRLHLALFAALSLLLAQHAVAQQAVAPEPMAVTGSPAEFRDCPSLVTQTFNLTGLTVELPDEVVSEDGTPLNPRS